jgi:hypothetical protein
MMRTLARYTEWAWSKGRFSSTDDLEQAAAEFYMWLEKQHEGAGGSLDVAGAEILNDMQKTLRVLSYGGRSFTDLSPNRKALLEQEAENCGWHEAA